MKRIVGYHPEIKALLEPVKQDIKSIKVFDGGFECEQVHVTFFNRGIWILSRVDGKWLKTSEI